MLIEWNDQWLIGEKRIDDEHRETVWLINRLYSAAEGKESKETISKIMASLLDLTHDHFAYEDRLMFAMRYPGAAEHRKKHQSLLDEIRSLTDDIADDKASLGNFNALNPWFIRHVLEDDGPLAGFLQSKPPASEEKQDPLGDIKERLRHSKASPKSVPSWADIEWLVTEVERLRSGGSPGL